MRKEMLFFTCGLLFAAESQSFDVDLKTLPPGKSFTIRFQVMIDDALPDTLQQVAAQGVVSVSGSADILTDDPDTSAAMDPTLTYVFQPPVAQCRNVTVVASDNLIASVSFEAVNNGSFDPDGPPFSIFVAPPGPYGLGTTNVTLTVLDAEGDTSACSAIITVIDPRTSLYPQDLIDLLESILSDDSSVDDLLRRSSSWYSQKKSGTSQED